MGLDDVFKYVFSTPVIAAVSFAGCGIAGWHASTIEDYYDNTTDTFNNSITKVGLINPD